MSAKNELTIMVWRFEDAPVVYQDLSPHGGDEDWVAFIPQGFIKKHGDYVSWCDPENGPFGVCHISEHQVTNGIVRIGAHA